MEDEVQSYIVAMLEKADHVVVTEANGTKALRRYSKEGPFDLVFGKFVCYSRSIQLHPRPLA